MADNVDDFHAAFAAELGVEPPKEETPPADDTPPAGDDTPPADDTGGEGETPPAPEQGGETPPEGEETPPEGDEEQPPAEEPPSADEPPKPIDRNDIISAIREEREAQQARQNRVSDVKQMVLEHLHPQGIDRKLYDSENRVINTAQDIVDRGLINPETKESFTYEEAARWMMNAQKELNQQVEQVEKYAEEIGEVYVNLKEGNDRVEELYGDYLRVMPGVSKQLSEMYFKTLRIDPETNIVIEAPLDPVEFYSKALAPYIKMAEQAVAQQQKEDAEAKKRANSQRDDRTGLPPRGSTKSKPNTGDPFLDALMNEMENE